MADVDLSTVVGYVLDRTDLSMKDCASLQLVNRLMNVVVCSQFYPHVQSVARLGLTDRVVARALKSPEIFFRKFPVMNDLHVPWNPPIIDSSAAIPITDACQLLTDYPQIRSLPPMYLEREGLEGLGGHSLRSVTFYPGRYDDEPSTKPSDDLNSTACKLQVEHLETVLDCETMAEEYVGLSSQIGMRNGSLMRRLLDNEYLKTLRQFIQIKENPEMIDHSHDHGHPNFCIDEAIGFDCMDNITDLSIWFKSIEQVHLCLSERKEGRSSTVIQSVKKFPSVKALHFERVCMDKKLIMEVEAGREYKYITDVGISDDVLSIFPSLEKLTAPRSCMVMEFDRGFNLYHLIRFGPSGQNYIEWVEKMIPIIFSSGLGAVKINYDNCMTSMNMNTDKFEQDLHACKTDTIKQLFLHGSFLAQRPLERFIEAFPKLEGLFLSSKFPLIDDAIFTILAKANLRSLNKLVLTGTSCTMKGVRKYIKWRHRQIEVLKKKMSPVNLVLPSGISRQEMQIGINQYIEEHVYMGAKIDLYHE